MGFDFDAARLARDSRGVDLLVEDCGEGDRRDLSHLPELLILHRQVQEIGQELEKMVSPAVDLAEQIELLARELSCIPLPQHLRQLLDRRDGRPEIMRGRQDEAALVLLGPLERPALNAVLSGDRNELREQADDVNLAEVEGATRELGYTKLAQNGVLHPDRNR